MFFLGLPDRFPDPVCPLSVLQHVLWPPQRCWEESPAVYQHLNLPPSPPSLHKPYHNSLVQSLSLTSQLPTPEWGKGSDWPGGCWCFTSISNRGTWTDGGEETDLHLPMRVFWLKGWPGEDCRFVKVEVRFKGVRDTQVCSERGLGDSCGVTSLVSPRSSALLYLWEDFGMWQRGWCFAMGQAGQLWYMNGVFTVSHL